MPTTPGAPAGQQVQISGQTAGHSSVRAVPPTPAQGCPATQLTAALGPGTEHENEVTQNETWTPEGSPHRINGGLTIRAGAALTLAPCAVVLIGHEQTLDVAEGGALMAVGDAQHPIRIGSASPTPQPGDWNSVYFEPQARQTSRLAFVTLEHGGGGSEAACLLNFMQNLDLQNVTAQNCRAFGVGLMDSGTFAATSTALRVTGTVAGNADRTGAVLVDDPDSLRTLPAGTYTGNARDEIVLINGNGNATIRTTATWRNPGVRYFVADAMDLRVEGPTGPVLTLAPGTTVAFAADASLAIGWDAEGGLIADGQSDATRITFTQGGSDSSPGSWEAIYFGEHYNRSQSRLNYVTIQNAGSGNRGLCDWSGGTGDTALVYILRQPTAELLQHVRFLGSPATGAVIGRSWNGTAVNFADAALGNDFSAAGADCHQSPVPSADGACPENSACQ